MASGFFITGTGTDVGKTVVTAAMLHALGRGGYTCAALKPLAAGAVASGDAWYNPDALLLQRHQTAELSYQQVNPVLLKAALAPHIAAQLEGRRLSVGQLAGYCRGVMLQAVDAVLIEGAGGWRVPLNRVEDLSALPRELQLPVVLVVGLQLGCLNHALLTVEAMQRDGVPLLGWVANQVDPAMAAVEANVDMLRARLPGHFMGYVPWLLDPVPESVADHINLCSLVERFRRP